MLYIKHSNFSKCVNHCDFFFCPAHIAQLIQSAKVLWPINFPAVSSCSLNPRTMGCKTKS